MGTSTTRRDDAGECLKLRSLLRLVRSSNRVRMRSKPNSVLPVKKSALMLGAACSTGTLLAASGILRCLNPYKSAVFCKINSSLLIRTFLFANHSLGIDPIGRFEDGKIAFPNGLIDVVYQKPRPE